MPEKNWLLFTELVTKFLDKNKIRTIFELGSRDGEEAAAFAQWAKQAVVYAFECNPSTLALCRQTLHPILNVRLVEKAVSNFTGRSTFYPIDQNRTVTSWTDGNPGASSLFRASGKYPIEIYVQNEIEVDTITLKLFMEDQQIQGIDLLWMDIQGAELVALEGLGERINDVKVIHTEVGFFEIYKKQPLYNDVKSFLNDKGFLLVKFTNFDNYSADAIFINKQLVKNFFSLAKYRIIDNSIFFWYHDFLPLKRKVFSRLNNKIHYWTNLRVEGDFLLSLKRLIHIIWFRYIREWLKLNLDFKNVPLSKLKLDIIIPVINKDFDVLPHTLEGIRNNLKHPVGDILIVAPKESSIISFCKKNWCKFIDEDTVFPFNKRQIKYLVDGIDRAGWLFQQLVKLHGDKLSSQKHFLIVDADTVFIRPCIFEHRGKIIFNQSDEFHKPYFDLYERLLGEKPKSALSFVCHSMLFEKKKLWQLKRKIEKIHNKKWYEAIIDELDTKQFSAFSELELYGNFILSYYPSKMIREYWFNITLPKEKLKNLKALEKQFSDKYKTISFHTHEKVSRQTRMRGSSG